MLFTLSPSAKFQKQSLNTQIQSTTILNEPYTLHSDAALFTDILNKYKSGFVSKKSHLARQHIFNRTATKGKKKTRKFTLTDLGPPLEVVMLGLIWKGEPRMLESLSCGRALSRVYLKQIF